MATETEAPRPGQWFMVDGQPFMIPFADRNGTAVKEGDQILFARDSLLTPGRIVTIHTDGTCDLRDLSGRISRSLETRPLSQVVLAR